MKLKPLPALPLLDPAVLDRSADEAARALMREGSSANTAASYRAAMRYWAAWFELRYGRRFALPCPRPLSCNSSWTTPAARPNKV